MIHTFWPNESNEFCNHWNNIRHFEGFRTQILLWDPSYSHGGEYEHAVFWVDALCNMVEVYRRFRGAYCIQHRGDEKWRQQAPLERR
jgi:hypothetical protein